MPLGWKTLDTCSMHIHPPYSLCSSPKWQLQHTQPQNSLDPETVQGCRAFSGAGDHAGRVPCICSLQPLPLLQVAAAIHTVLTITGPSLFTQESAFFLSPLFFFLFSFWTLSQFRGAEPTAAGETTLDAFHVLGRVKRLDRHPVKALAETDKFLRVLQAHQDGLITFRLEVRFNFCL